MIEETKVITTQERTDRIGELNNVIRRANKEMARLEKIALIEYRSLVGKYFKEHRSETDRDCITYRSIINIEAGNILKMRRFAVSKSMIDVNSKTHEYASFAKYWIEISQEEFSLAWKKTLEKLNEQMNSPVQKLEGGV